MKVMELVEFMNNSKKEVYCIRCNKLVAISK